MKQNIKLLNAIRNAGLTQAAFAKLVGDSDSYVSMSVRGRLNLDNNRKAKYARVLGKSVPELFEA